MQRTWLLPRRRHWQLLTALTCPKCARPSLHARRLSSSPAVAPLTAAVPPHLPPERSSHPPSNARPYPPLLNSSTSPTPHPSASSPIASPLPPPATSPSPLSTLSPHSQPRFIEGQLTRDFISASLYSSSSGYFNLSSRISTPSPLIPFASLPSRDAYYAHLSSLYDQLPDSFLTPVELFAPHYAHAIARWILHSLPPPTHLPSQPPTTPLRIIEVGGGNGTCAAGILDYLALHHPSLYARTHYTIVDLSATNQVRQRATLQPHLQGGVAGQGGARVELVHGSVLDWSEYVEGEAFVICLEVLDNMPHDKVVHLQQQPHETRVHSMHHTPEPGGGAHFASDTALVDPKQKYRETYHPVSDPFISEYLQYHAEYEGQRRRRRDRHEYGSFSNHLAVRMRAASTGLQRFINFFVPDSLPLFVPTTALHLLHLLHHFIPRHHLLIADFTSLPDAIIGINAPIVSAKEPIPSSPSSPSSPSTPPTSRVRDFRTYLIELGVADIFFPTDFPELRYVYNRVRAERRKRDAHRQPPLPDELAEVGKLMTDFEFMRAYAVDAARKEWEAQRAVEGQGGEWKSPTETRSGWDPLLQDYVNFHFFVT